MLGGIIIIWEISVFVATNRIIHNRWIVVEGRLSEHDFECCIGIVYII